MATVIKGGIYLWRQKKKQKKKQQKKQTNLLCGGNGRWGGGLYGRKS